MRATEAADAGEADQGVDDASAHEPARRMRLAREADGSVGLTLSDAAGRARITLRVEADGPASIRVLAADGNVVAELPGR